jgi:uncharacterized protein (TIGR02328 family)
MVSRGYNPSIEWRNPNYRGRAIGIDLNWTSQEVIEELYRSSREETILFKEHDINYINECIGNLEGKLRAGLITKEEFNKILNWRDYFGSKN